MNFGIIILLTRMIISSSSLFMSMRQGTLAVVAFPLKQNMDGC